MKIAFIISALSNKGPCLVVRDLVDEFLKLNMKPTVYFFDDINELSFNCPCHRIGFFEKIDFNEFDVIHSHGIRPDSYVFLHKKKVDNPIFVTTLHNYMHVDLKYQYNFAISYIFSKLWLQILKHHDIIITLSNHAKVYYSQWIDDNKIRYVYNGKSVNCDFVIDDKVKGEILEFKKDNILIGVNALLTYRKGIDQLILALKYLPDYSLVVIGDGKSKQQLENLALSTGVLNRCLFLGMKSKAYQYLPLYDIYAMVSRSEGFPLSLIEAAAYGKPTVCSDIPIFEEIFSKDEVSFYELDNINSLVNSISTVLYNKDMPHKLKQKYLTKYNVSKMAKDYIYIYKNKSLDV